MEISPLVSPVLDSVQTIFSVDQSILWQNTISPDDDFYLFGGMTASLLGCSESSM